MVNSTQKILAQMQSTGCKEKTPEESAVYASFTPHTPQLPKEKMLDKLKQCMPGIEGCDFTPNS